MSSVSVGIFETIKVLQSLPSLSAFALGGGTRIALQYNHRISVDIDFFCPDIIGRAGFATIVKEVSEYYGDRAQRFDFPCEIDDQYIFLRFYIEIEDGSLIKVELLQNMKMLDQIEDLNGIRMISKKDIGIFKLVSATNRGSKKDIYDLDFITNDILLVDLYKAFVVKTERYNKDSDKTIFDLEEHKTLINNPEVLLIFDTISGSQNLPNHSHDQLDIVLGHKLWVVAQIDWRTKVRRLYQFLGKDFPKPQGIPIKGGL